MPEINVLEVVLDALECRIAYALQVEQDMEKVATTFAVLETLKRRAKEEGMTFGESDGTRVKGAQA